MNELVDSMELSLKHENWYAALTIALIIPDIYGKVDDPSISSKNRYIAWYNKHVLAYHRSNGQQIMIDGKIILTGNDCYAIRCAMLHEFSEDLSSQKAAKVLAKYKFYKPTSVDFGFSLKPLDGKNGEMKIRVDDFCEYMRIGVIHWGNETPTKVFSDATVKII